MPPKIGSVNLLLYIILFFLIFILVIFLKTKIRQAWNWTIIKVSMGLGSIATSLASFLQRMERRLTQNLKTKGDDLYEELTPLDNADQDGVYDQQLKWALGKKNIRNIAVTGTYGSGKSSVIKTFQKNHREYSYLNISLASFPESTSTTKSESGSAAKREGKKSEADLDGQLIEFSILQQIILHIHYNRLPGSRFHRIRHQKRWRTLILTISLTVFSFTACYLFNWEFFDRMIDALSWKAENNWLNMLPWLFIAGFIFITYSLLRVYANSMISKVKIPAAELELQTKEASVLNRQIEEILYFFEVTNYDVVVIEDLDRFGDPRIFTKLREINMLINNAQQVKRNVVFLYVLGDHVFKGESRTKFFDYIVPVIPIVNSSNAYQLLTDRIKKANLIGSLPDQFIDEVSLYISDMRLLKNIMNEFNLYYGKLKKDKISTLNDTYLFSLVVYKNLCPEDFALLQNGKGLVVSEFERKINYIQSQTNMLITRNEELNNLITTEKSVLLNSVEELRIVYVTKWLGMQQKKAVAFEIDSTIYTVDQLVKDEHFSKLRLRDNGRVEYLLSYGGTTSTTSLKLNFETAAQKIDSKTTYDQKENALRARSTNLTEQWKTELGKNKEDINRIKGFSLKDLLGKIQSADLSPELRSSRLLEFLLRSGYINEEYPYYISHFYPGSLLLTEHEFILDLKERKAKPYNYLLVNIPAILKRLYAQDYQQDAILNFYLLDFLLQQDREDSTRLISIFQLLSNEKKNSTDFVDQFIYSEKSTSTFVKRLSHFWKNWWNYLNEHPTATDEFKQKCYFLLMKHAEIPQLKMMNMTGNVSAWLSELRNFDIPEQKLMGLLTELSVKVKHVTDENLLSPSLVDHLCSHSLYEINPEMISLLIRKRTANPEDPLIFSSQPFSALRASEFACINDYININIDIFTSQVVLVMESRLEELEGTMIEILGNAEITMLHRQALIQKMSLRMGNLNQVIKELWVPLLQENKILSTWSNICAYYDQVKVVDDVLARYVNRIENVQKLSENMQHVNEEHFHMAQALLNSPLILAPVFEKIVPLLGREMSEVNFKELNVHKLELLVERSFIPFDKEHFSELRNKSRELSLKYLILNKSELLKAVTDYELDSKDYFGLLNSDKISKEEKFSILAQISDELYEFSPLATLVAKFILYDEASIPFNTRLLIVQYCSDKDLSIRMAIQQLDTAPDVIDQMLNAMGGNYTALTQKDQKISFSDTPTNRTLFSKLRKTGHVYKISTNNNESTVTVYTQVSSS